MCVVINGLVITGKEFHESIRIPRAFGDAAPETRQAPRAQATPETPATVEADAG